jgi:hypothetical protein
MRAANEFIRHQQQPKTVNDPTAVVKGAKTSDNKACGKVSANSKQSQDVDIKQTKSSPANTHMSVGTTEPVGITTTTSTETTTATTTTESVVTVATVRNSDVPPVIFQKPLYADELLSSPSESSDSGSECNHHYLASHHLHNHQQIRYLNGLLVELNLCLFPYHCL